MSAQLQTLSEPTLELLRIFLVRTTLHHHGRFSIQGTTIETESGHPQEIRTRVLHWDRHVDTANITHMSSRMNVDTTILRQGWPKDRSHFGFDFFRSRPGDAHQPCATLCRIRHTAAG